MLEEMLSGLMHLQQIHNSGCPSLAAKRSHGIATLQLYWACGGAYQTNQVAMNAAIRSLEVTMQIIALLRQNLMAHWLLFSKLIRTALEYLCRRQLIPHGR
jgi:hypothetical protein